MNDKADRILLIVGLIVVAMILGAIMFRAGSPTAPLTNAQLASAIEHDASSRGIVAHVTCHTLASPGPDGADRMCREALMSFFCAAPATPSRTRLAVRVEGRGYHEVERLTESTGECSAF